MKQEEMTRTLSDDLTQYTHIWEPDGDIVGTVVLVHGLGEHCMRYQHVADKFAKSGFAMIGFDHRGHGKTEGKRGHIPGYEAAMNDIQYHLALAAKKYPGKPIFLYGHSMGGSFCLYFLLTRKPSIAGAIITSPGLAVAKPVPPATLFLGKIMSGINPSMQMANGLDRSGLSRDPDVEKAYSSDPLVHGYISAKLAIEMLGNGQWIINHANELSIPTLLLQGSADRLVSPAATEQFANKVKSTDFTFKVWDGYYHELHNEPEKEIILKTMMDWLKAHC